MVSRSTHEFLKKTMKHAYNLYACFGVPGCEGAGAGVGAGVGTGAAAAGVVVVVSKPTPSSHLQARRVGMCAGQRSMGAWCRSK